MVQGAMSLRRASWVGMVESRKGLYLFAMHTP
jgi:hypothetical protein